ncbi:hypothetical protein OH77DRAFT_630504 [Trametes cingulata]|nr:hypothetical protein OH77DRAFT_630504 [Trametes cingulata]
MRARGRGVSGALIRMRQDGGRTGTRQLSADAVMRSREDGGRGGGQGGASRVLRVPGALDKVRSLIGGRADDEGRKDKSVRRETRVEYVVSRDEDIRSRQQDRKPASHQNHTTLEDDPTQKVPRRPQPAQNRVVSPVHSFWLRLASKRRGLCGCAAPAANAPIR